MIRKDSTGPTRTHSGADLQASVDKLDRADFPALFREHAPFVWRVVRRYGVAQSDLEDVCQDVFMVVHRRLSEFEGRSSLRTWLYEIARRTALAQRRRRGQQPSSPLDDVDALDAGQPLPADQLEQREALRWLWRCLATLDDDKREAFVLYELEDMTLAEVAAAVGAPLNTVHYRIQVARDALKQHAERADAGMRLTGAPAGGRP